MPRDTAIAETMLAPSDPQPRVDPDAASTFDGANRYATRRVLGDGGMGEVRLTTDAWIGRDVAMKVVQGRARVDGRDARALRARGARPGAARAPGVVPVYDLGNRPTAKRSSR